MSLQWADAWDEVACPGELGRPACSLTRAGAPRHHQEEDGTNSPNRENFLANGQLLKEARTMLLISSMPDSLSPTLEPDYPGDVDRLGGAWLQLHGIQLEVTKGSKMGLEIREQFTYWTLILKVFLSSRNGRQTSHVRRTESPPGCVHLSLLSNSRHFICKWGGTVCGSSFSCKLGKC